MCTLHVVWLGEFLKHVLWLKYIEGVMVAATYAQPDRKGVMFSSTFSEIVLVASCKVFLVASERRLQ